MMAAAAAAAAAQREAVQLRTRVLFRGEDARCMQRTARASSASNAGPRPDASLSPAAEADVLTALLDSAAARDSSSEVGAIAFPQRC
jgi:hypothetical protein